MQNKLQKVIIYAKNKGMRVEPDGTIIGMKNKPIKGTIDHRGYIKVCVKFHKKDIPVYIHRLQAYQKFGDKIFEDGMQVRHLNGDSQDNSWSNIAIGTMQQNHMDKKPMTRLNAARKAALAQRKYTNNQVEEIRSRKKSGESLNSLARSFNTTKGHISQIVNKVIYNY